MYVYIYDTHTHTYIAMLTHERIADGESVGVSGLRLEVRD